MLRTILTRIEGNARFFPKKPAIILPDRMINYQMLLNGVFSVQTVIRDLRLSRDAPVGLLVDNPIRHIVIFLALIRSGLTVTSMRKEHVIENHVNNQVLITDHDLMSVPTKIAYVEDDWFTQKNPPELSEFCFEENRIARILFTSGSTGFPKAIGWSFSTLHKRVQDIYTSGIGYGDRFLTTYGLSNAGLYYALRVLSDGKTVIFSKIEDALDMALTYCADEMRCSAIQAKAIIDFQEDLRYPIHLKTFSTGGGQLSVETAANLRHWFTCEIINTYVSTECGLAGLARGKILKDREQKGNCFFPLANIEIVNKDNILIGGEGLIRIKSMAMAWEYRGALEEKDSIKGDGWFYPGDVGYIDNDGLLVVTGRIDEVMNVGGVKFAPDVIEEIIKKHPKLKDAAVVRVSFDKNATHPCIAVVSSSKVTLEEINDWLPGEVIGELQTVQFHKMLKLDSIPKTGTGKIDRNVLRKLFFN